MAKRNEKPGYRYGLILNQEKYPVKVHKSRTAAYGGTRFLEAQCGAGVNQSKIDLEDRRNRIEVQVRLLDEERTVYCLKCWKE